MSAEKEAMEWDERPGNEQTDAGGREPGGEERGPEVVYLYDDDEEDEFADVPRFDDAPPARPKPVPEPEPAAGTESGKPRYRKRDGYPFVQEGEEERVPRRSSRFEQYIGQVLSGNIFTRAEVRRQYPYMLFMALLMFLYIANIFHMQKLYRQHDRLNAQLKELRAKSLTISSERMMRTRQSEIVRELDRRGIPLRESVTPPQIIEK